MLDQAKVQPWKSDGMIAQGDSYILTKSEVINLAAKTRFQTQLANCLAVNYFQENFYVHTICNN